MYPYLNFLKNDKIKAPTTPNEAASVAVAIPVYIDPITAKINSITGKSCFDLFNFSKMRSLQVSLACVFY